ncbi:hypothetical protein [Paenibacillus rhizophilus]|uniref:hypothetical protein n=1 Tax=Paenibacillus rhizophilus TaxID=1850366 RepID=UPI00163B27E6|nr:hypothetical protein [Paenibacillus rhizophilus]
MSSIFVGIRNTLKNELEFTLNLLKLPLGQTIFFDQLTYVQLIGVQSLRSTNAAFSE